MRNILVHDDSVDLDILWHVVENELPALRSDIEELRTRMEEREPGRSAGTANQPSGRGIVPKPRPHYGVVTLC